MAARKRRPSISPLGRKCKRLFSLTPELNWALDQFDTPLAVVVDEALWAWLDVNEPDAAEAARKLREDAAK
jgi:hypothetical protein